MTPWSTATSTTLKLNTLTDYQSPGPMGTFSSTIGWTTWSSSAPT